MLGYLTALGAALVYGASHTVARKVTSDMAAPLVATSLALLFGLLYVSLFFRPAVFQHLRLHKQGILWFSLSGLASAWGITFMYFALSHAPLVVVGPTVAANPLVTMVMAHFFLRNLERITSRVFLGVLLVVSGVGLVVGSQAIS